MALQLIKKQDNHKTGILLFMECEIIKGAFLERNTVQYFWCMSCVKALAAILTGNPAFTARNKEAQQLISLCSASTQGLNSVKNNNWQTHITTVQMIIKACYMKATGKGLNMQYTVI